MDRRNFVKRLGGTGLAMVCGDALGATLAATADDEKQDVQEWSNGCLRFNSTGRLKVVQFTDVHYKWEDQRNSQPGLDVMNEVLDKEKPDFVIYTGDLVFSEGTFEGLDRVLDLSIRRNIPFAVVWGNHDAEYDHSREELYDYVQQKKGALMPKRVVDHSPDYVVPVKGHKGDRVVALLYCIDSNAYAEDVTVGGYDWIHRSQIDWYREVSRQYTETNDKAPLPALAFFHIAVPEFRDAVMEERNRMFGVKGERVCSPKVNSGFFMAAKECRDIMAMFVGHDHDNDYAVMYKGVLLAYGRYSGGDTVYNDIPNGARVIELYEGERKLDTYIRMAHDQVDTRITYPDSFVKQRYNKVPKTAEELALEKMVADANAKTQADALAKEAAEARKKAEELTKKAEEARAKADKMIKKAKNLK